MTAARASTGIGRAGPWLTVAIGIAWIAAAQALAPPLPMPLFDGVVVEDPYLFLQPPPGAAGDPTSYSQTAPLENGQTPQVVANTQENPPQAQLIAAPGAFQISPGTTSITVTIKAVPAPAVPSTGHIAGNVYAITVTNQAGTALGVQPASPVTVVLRAPAGVGNGIIARYAGGAWQGLQSEAAGLQFMYVVNVTALGDFAVVAPGGGASPSASPAASPVGSAAASLAAASPSVVPLVPAPSASPLSDPPILAAFGATLLLGAALLLVVIRRSAEQRRLRARRAPGWGGSRRRR